MLLSSHPHSCKLLNDHGHPRSELHQPGDPRVRPVALKILLDAHRRLGLFPQIFQFLQSFEK